MVGPLLINILKLKEPEYKARNQETKKERKK
jgi:hypothetical protein